MLKRRVYRMPKAGSMKNLQLQTEVLEEPKADEVCVQVKAIGLNFADIFVVHGLYNATPAGSFIPGLEFSGEIIAVGSAVKEWKAGDRVMGVTRFGGFVSHLNMHHQYVVPLPSGWNFEEGAGFLVQALTAWYALVELGNLQRGMTVLIHSAAGGVGILANRICKRFGAYTIGTVGSGKKVPFLLQQESYDDVIVRDKNFPAKLTQALGDRPLLLILECIGGKIMMQGWNAMAPMGRMVLYGNATFTSHGNRPNYLKLYWKYLRRPKFDSIGFAPQNKSLMGFNLIYLYDQTAMIHQMLDKLMALQLKPQHIGHVFSFEEMHQAIHLLQSGETIGKVVVRLS